jgi:mxaJ protein
MMDAPGALGSHGAWRVAAVLAVMAAVGTAAAVAARAREPQRVLRVCADPNNLPFSNEAGQGLENRMAELVASELGARVEYVWWAQRRGFFRNTLNAGICDLVPGVPTSMELAWVTRPYYRSTYVFVSRADRALGITSFNDSALRTLRVGVTVIGDDYANSPAAEALASRGIVGTVVGYSVYGDYRQPNPPARIVQGVVDGEVDLAVVWGPLAAYFAARQPVPLVITPVSPQVDLPFLPFVFDIGMGVRRGDDSLHAQVEAALDRRAEDVRRILDEYRVPQLRTPRVRRPASPARG